MKRSTSSERLAFFGNELHIVVDATPFESAKEVVPRAQQSTLADRALSASTALNLAGDESENKLLLGLLMRVAEFANVRRRLFNGYSTTSPKRV
jgi:hypothetical protein